MSSRTQTISAHLLPRAALLAGALLLAASPALPPIGQTRVETSAPKPARWSPVALAELRAAVADAAADGLDPARYRLPAAPDDAVADEAALTLAGDFAHGRVKDRARFGWHVEAPTIPPDLLRRQLDAALSRGELRAWLAGLLPTAPQYRALREALATLGPDDPRRTTVLANMERWRWMPRAWGGERHLWVNVPSQQVKLMEDGVARAVHVAVVGAPDTPTPALSATAVSVVVNPWWTVPQSMIRRGEVPTGRGAARRGYLVERGEGGGVRVRQRPGPGNALGRVKIEMPNAHAIYLHDTPAKAAFALPRRARSHGCVRVQDIEGLATALTDEPLPLIDALAEEDTQTVHLGRRWPVWVVYFTLDLDADGRLVGYPDLYGRDAALAAALTGKRMRPAPEPEPAAEPAPTPTPAAAPVRPRPSAPSVEPEPEPEPPLPDPVEPAPIEIAPEEAPVDVPV